MPVSFNSLRNAFANDRSKAFVAPYTASNGAGIAPATEDVIRTLPSPRATICFSTRFARSTTDVTFNWIIFSSSLRSVSRVKSPPTPIPAFMAIASTGRPVCSISRQSCSTPSYVERSLWTVITSNPRLFRSEAARSSLSPLELISRSYPFSPNTRASS